MRWLAVLTDGFRRMATMGVTSPNGYLVIP